MTPTFPAPLPHADTVARVRAAAFASGKMANAMMRAQWSDILFDHPDVQVMDAREKETP